MCLFFLHALHIIIHRIWVTKCASHLTDYYIYWFFFLKEHSYVIGVKLEKLIEPKPSAESAKSL